MTVSMAYQMTWSTGFVKQHDMDPRDKMVRRKHLLCSLTDHLERFKSAQDLDKSVL